jgi:hypothetical protein
MTPNFFTLVKNPDEFQSFLDLTTQKQPLHATGCVVRLFDAQRVLGEHLMNMTQIRLDALSKYVEESFHTFLEKKTLIIDPGTEYLFYESCVPRWTSDKALPLPLMNHARRCQTKKKNLNPSEYSKWKEAYHTLFWNEMSKDATSRNRMIGEVFDLELHYRSAILLPPVPLVRSHRQMKISIQINEVAQGISARRNAEYANYFIIPQHTLGYDEESMDELLKYLRNPQPRITVLKFKYLDLTTPGRVSLLVAYRDFLQQLSFLKETHKDRIFIVLENGYQVFPSATVGFDITSTSMTGYDGDSQYGQGEYGAWFDPEQMVHVSFKDLKKICKNNHNRLPCAHDTCENINVATIDPDPWNRVRRVHYVRTMNDYMTMIAKAIRDKKIELAIDKLVNSDVNRLKKLIPRR